MVEWSSAACQIYVVNDLAMKFPFFENTTNWLTMSLKFSYFPLLSILLFNLCEWCIFKTWFHIFAMSWSSYYFFCVIPRCLNFVCQCFGTFSSIFIGSVSRNNNQDEIVGVFTQEKVWLKNSLSQPQRGGMGRGRGHVWVEKQAGEQRPKVEACSKHVRDKWPRVIARKEIHGMVEIKLLCFRWLSPFMKCV